MRIAFATPEYVTEKNYDGGLSNYLHRVVLALKNLGHDPVVFVYSDRDEVLVHRDIEVHRIDCRPPYERLRLPFKPLVKPIVKELYRFWGKHVDRSSHKKKLESDSRRLNDALLHSHRQKSIDIVQYASFMASGLCRHPSIPSIVRASSYDPLWAVAYGRPRNQYAEECEMSALKRADAVFAPSHLIASHLEKELNRPVNVIETPFFMEAEGFDEALLDTFGLWDKKYLLFFGTIGLLKGCLTIAKTLNRLFAQYPNLSFVFAGKAFRYRRKKFDVLIRNEVKDEYQDRVIFTGQAKHSQLYPVIQAAEGVVLPSRVDNLPNTCLESMGLGQIVVGTRGASFDQLIDDGESGFLCEIDDPDSLFEAMAKLLSLSGEKKRQMSEAARERIKKLHPDIVVPQLLDFYQEVIAGHRPNQAVKKAA